MKRILVVLIAALVAIVPAAAASAQSEREIEPEVELLDGAAADLNGGDAEGWQLGLDDVEASLGKDRKSVV